MGTLRPATRLYIASIVLAAVSAAAFAASSLAAPAASAHLIAAAIAGLTALAYRFPLSIDLNTRSHLDTAVVFAAVLLLEPGLAVPAVGIGTLVVNALSLHARDVGGWAQAGFNGAQVALQAAMAGLILAVPGWDPTSPAFGDPVLLGAMLAAGVAMYLVNTLSVATVIALQESQSPLRIWRHSSAVMDRTEALAHLAQLGLGLLAAIVADAQWWAPVLLLLPAAAVYSGLQGHVRVRRRIEDRLAVAQEIAHLGSWEWNVAGDNHAWSDETFRILGYDPGAFIPSQGAFLDAAHAEDRAVVREALIAIAAGTERTIEHRIRRPDGSVRVVQLIGEVQRDGRGRPTRVLGTLHDITERKTMEEALAHRAYHDPLTDLPNRALFAERLGKALARADRQQRGLAVLYLDLDGFKAINDRHGHGAGDDLLIAVARRLGDSLRSADTLARRGGDEFTVLLEDLGEPDEAERVATHLIAAVSRPHLIGEENITVGASIGMAYRPPHADPLIDAEALLASADAALYAAKRAGKGRYVVADRTSARATVDVEEFGQNAGGSPLVATR